MKLPRAVVSLILGWHDEYNMIDKRKKLNLVVESGFRRWLYFLGAYNHEISYNHIEYSYTFYHFSWLSYWHVFPSPPQWNVFMRIMRETDAELSSLVLLPSQLDLII